jgi:hypothetical protein
MGVSRQNLGAKLGLPFESNIATPILVARPFLRVGRHSADY